ncbi:hypothetical protein EGW08_018047 [Elysia chlorotica]|uniref:CUB domain-containing protein n=1 Tax=Elysia chlorotica TaxID=188477 RepID=A0A3S1AWQ9_ELYCH|nr:hypothetical protein EGW08_018047 [Elysia chlorotica]
MWIFHTLATCLLLVVYQALALKCGEDVNPNKSSTGFFNGPPSVLEAGKDCNVTVLLPEGNSSITVHLSLVSIAPGDRLLIYDGIQNLLASFTAETVANKVLVGFQSKMVFAFKPLAASSKSTWSARYNTEECAVSLQNSWVLSLDSPSYVNTSAERELECTYTVTSFLPTDFIAAAAFTEFSLSGNSSLDIDGAQGSPSYTGELTLFDQG